MKKITKIFLLFILSSLLSCQNLLKDQITQDCDYSNCNTQEPFQAPLYIYFTRAQGQPDPMIIILSGTWDQHNVIDTVRTDTVPIYRDFTVIMVPVDHYYTVAAKYIRNSDTIYAIDGSNVSKQSFIQCDSICWKIVGNNLSVKLKNY